MVGLLLLNDKQMHILEYFIFKASNRGSLYYPSNFQWPCNTLHAAVKAQYCKQ